MTQARRESEPRRFVYVGVRPFFPAVPQDELHPQAFTRAVVDKVIRAATATAPFELRLFTTGFDQPYASTPKCTSNLVTEKIDLLPPGEAHPVRGVEGLLEFEARLENSLVAQAMCDHRDIQLAWQHAYTTRSVHWGTENWGGLSIELWSGGHRLVRTDIDAFASEDDDLVEPRIFLFALCEHPDERGFVEASRAAQISYNEAAAVFQPYRCPACGARGAVDDVFMGAVNRAADSYMLLSCESCRARLELRILSQSESESSGYVIEVRRI